jgi:hypothetical protein
MQTRAAEAETAAAAAQAAADEAGQRQRALAVRVEEEGKRCAQLQASCDAMMREYEKELAVRCDGACAASAV